MAISWPTMLFLQIGVIYLLVCVFTQHQYSTPQVTLYLIYLFYVDREAWHAAVCGVAKSWTQLRVNQTDLIYIIYYVVYSTNANDDYIGSNKIIQGIFEKAILKS